MAEKITVRSEALRQRQQEWLSFTDSAREAFTEVTVNAQNLSGIFEGNPVRVLQREFAALGEEGTAAFKALSAQVARLSEIAAVYEAAERSNTDVTADN